MEQRFQLSRSPIFSAVNQLLCPPGTIQEIETILLDGQIQCVYKNQWPSLRAFWIWAAHEHKEATYLYPLFQDVYHVRKSDRVAICARNYPDYIVAFWACRNWSPQGTLRYCLIHIQCKLIIVDPECADRLEPISKNLVTETGSSGILVLEACDGKGFWEGMQTWDSALKDFKGDGRKLLDMDLGLIPEDNATILFTSGTTGNPKGVLSTQRQFLTNIINVTIAGRRAILRRGEEIPEPVPGPQKGILISAPLFHVAGITTPILASLSGMKIVLMRKWDRKEASRLIKNENVAIAGGVPSVVSDLTDISDGDLSLESIIFGGSPAPDTLALRAGKAFPAAVMSQGYGLTETNGAAVGFAGEDYVARPTSCGLATPVNDVIIMNGDTSVPPGTVGEVWLRGPNVMKGYWRDQDGWLKTGDLGLLDNDGFLYIRDRIKDVIIRGGENIDSVSVENAFYADDRVLEVAAVGVPDARLGELVSAVVFIKPAYKGEVTEASLKSIAQKSLPKFSVPVMIVMQDEPFERTPSGKILKVDLRKVAAKEWARRSGQTNTTTAKL
ncbi:acetyl-CoA synthetase-like protein [Phlegmacium glaucopus]|nr:acetyl-CoA synthetase-like protein [Phlegmacium glaucopus]